MQLVKFAWRQKQLACLAAAICLYACSSDSGGMPRQAVVAAPGTGGATPIGSGGANPLGNAGGSGKGTPAITGSGGKGMAGMAGVGAVGSGGKGGTGGAMAGSGGATAGSGGSPGPGPVVTATDPVLPEITGECPDFRSGTLDFGGLSGIDMQVGAKGNGGGSIVFYWHGTGSSSFEAAQFGGTSEVLAAGGIIVAPSGSSGQGGDCSGTGTFSIGDMDTADQIAACAVRDYAIDPHRIYTTGCSAGGLQAACFAVLRSNYVAAAAPNSGGLTFPQAFQNPSHAPALMTMHGGDADMVVIYFRDSSKTADDAFKKAGGFVINCDHSGTHCGAPGDLEAAAWTFMKDHPFGVSPEPYTSLPAGFPDYCTIY